MTAGLVKTYSWIKGQLEYRLLSIRLVTNWSHMANNWRENVLLKKTRRHAFDFFRVFMPREGRAIVINSLPKSGTHLMINLINQMYKVTDTANFIVSATSFLGRRPGVESNCTALARLLASELCAAHLEFDDRYARAFRQNKVFHIFLYRDPLSVFFSEYHYLKNMNKWHHLHRKLNALAEEDGIAYLLGGQGKLQSSSDRYGAYSIWLQDKDTLSIRYEDLIADPRAIEQSITARCPLESNSDFNRDLAYGREYSHTASGSDTGHSVLKERYKSLVSVELKTCRLDFGYE